MASGLGISFRGTCTSLLVLGVTSTGPCESPLALVRPALEDAAAAAAAAAELAATVVAVVAPEVSLVVPSFGATYSS